MYQPNEFESRQQMIEMSSNKKSSENELGRNDRNDETGHEIVEAPPSGDDDEDSGGQKNKRQRFHRHTNHQIQEMEAYFKDCPHPDDKQRRRLGRELGLEPLQVKFWFQNKRTQVKSHQERRENALLKAENEKLRGENIRYKEALSSATCPTCGGTPALGEMCFDEQQLKVENTRLREEIERVSRVAAKFGVRAGGSYYNMSPQNNMASRPLDYGGSTYGGNELLSSLQAPLDAEKPIIVELAVAAVDELIKLAIDVDNLWVPVDHGTEVLNHDQYIRTCATGLMGPKPLGLKTEASRETAVVIMNHSNLVEIFMDVNKWSTMFYGIVARAMAHEVLSTGVAGNYNGAMQVMSAEFVVPSSLVPTRDNYFVRYCKQHSEDSWIVVDVSLDHLRPTATSRSRRRPSGCIIQELPNGYSKVIWVEHAEVDEGGVHDFYKPLVNSCLAFGAKRWVASLDRQCERLASAMATNIPTGDLCVITTHAGRKSMLRVAERMIMSFCSGVGASTAHWTQLAPTGNDDVKVMTRKSVDDPGRPSGIVLNATTSLWLPVPPKRLFDFLRDENSRNQWDILSNGGLVQEMAHIANGRDPGNCVSLLRVNCTSISQTNMLILQESLTDATGSYVVYAPIDLASMNAVLIGGDPDTVALLPSGFAVLPDGPTLYNEGPIMEVGTGGSLLTVAFQILVDSVPTAKIAVGSVTTVSNLIQCTIERIRAAVMCNTGF